MLLNVYAVFDSASGVYDRPFVMQTDGAAMRSFSDIAQDAQHPIGMHPEDYSLFRLGTYDDNKGIIKSQDRECVITALEACAEARKKVSNESQLGLLKEVN